MKLIFLDLGEVIAIHHDQIKRYGGSHGIRDLSLLQSAIAAPAAAIHGQYLHEDVAAMAGAYLFHIVSNHPFIDGNKRTGAVAALVFLALKRIDFHASQDSFEELVRAVASGKADRAEVVEFFRNFSGPR